MKKALSLLLILILLFSFSGCEKEEVEEKPMTAYIDWFGVTIDVRQLVKNISPSALFDGEIPTFESKINRFNENNVSYAVVRAKCIGNWAQNVFEDLHYDSHKNYRYLSPLYIEIPFEIIEVLEGDKSIVEGVKTVTVEYPHLYVDFDGMYSAKEEWNNNMPMRLTYDETAYEFLYPRADFEYVLILHYNEITKCHYSDSAAVECELSLPEEQLAFANNFWNAGYTKETPSEEYLSHNYYEILDRYNITVE